ncbi:acetyl-CoA carboxylase biotin carboxylase subunit [Peribacillus frigoritolerans]|jgi:acetyl-CoA carboxylase biotin carboxylase subunit|uniref:acetyl-CoA carboxylase biotin carboxylase subunit n=1 Tax=Peribacillus TaxID=2675229 RepID=UPI0006AC7200|nr:acetyl-CoA carboxylase biotin carboxylase subunit [Peribacillus frigoritolerans]KOR78753.1 biotin carboxylase [Bacillus sp. FJAT-21352]MED4690910.1 acetyl-CoA carboxylase biotin carboxylase subunit [Peribacillus frigoritolerans]WHX64162.1 acetyl-CoA carboxylase biotin carboxylase subunit [Peribacillus frigoritolerans]
MIRKILIANRGEIASRIIRTCKKLGILTVAVHSEADSDSPFVGLADEAYLLGGPRVQESYLNVNKILEIAKETGAEAIHPGYGFLSENADFARSCEEAGLIFIGPKPEIIQQMGNKVEARKTMEQAGLPLVPGFSRPLIDSAEAAAVAEKIGYPVMLKAAAGGGGIGMQAVANEDELTKAFEGNQKRAQLFFGNGDMFIEKLIEKPRHIEIQVLADSFGNAVYLWERECSVQRRHQKVVEEAPSSFLDEETRNRMGMAAVKAVKSIGYSNAGTLEFLVDADKNFYFLEMNTRLQVEHPVTEEITGLDLVEQQIKIASGNKLDFTQSEIKQDGHSIEVRIYAEDPKTFYPAPGRITTMELPEGEGIRHELAVHGTSVVSHFYDPMIAKLVVSGDSRDKAIERLREALASYKIEGIKTNLPLLMEIISHEAFSQGDTTTDFIAKYIQKLTV